MKLYAFSTTEIPKHAEYLKIGETNGSIEHRLEQECHELNVILKLEWSDAVITDRRGIDKMIHRYLVNQGFSIQTFEKTGRDTEWLKCTVADIERAFAAVKNQLYNDEIEKQALCDRFYIEIRNWYYWVVQSHREQHAAVMLEHTLRLIVRLLFCYFLQDKGLMPKELFDDKEFLRRNLKETGEYRFYDAVLRNLFFNCLNKPVDDRSEIEHKKHIENLRNVKEQFQKIPFLNGGLFNVHDGDEISLSHSYFFSEPETRHIAELDTDAQVAGILRILAKYTFKLTTDDLFDKEYVEAVDPEFIGKIFECLLACIDTDSKETRRKMTGSFYTPREIVDYMVSTALDGYCENNADLLQCKILDPACGSGAFPCGVMNEILRRIDPDKHLSQSERYRTKLNILRNVIYGVDIQPMAVQITELRLFLSLIQDITKDKNKTNFGIEPLPNLETKFVCANTLIGLPHSKQRQIELPMVRATIEQLQDTRSQHFMSNNVSEKQQLRKYDETLRKTLSIAMEETGDLSHETASLLLGWNPYDQSVSAPFFDPQWMFGTEKFDIVIGNPPYDVLTTKHPLLDDYRSKFRCTSGGKVNLYKLFFEQGLFLTRESGRLVFITPYNYLTSADSIVLRKMLLEETTISEIVDYEESQKVFESSTQAVAIIKTTKQLSPDYTFLYKKLGKSYSLKTKSIKQDSRLLFKGTNSILSKINRCKHTFETIVNGWQGEVNVSTKKESFVAKRSAGYLPLIRGNQIGFYQTVLKPSEYCPIDVTARSHHGLRRIVFQEVSNSGQERRIKGTILKNVLCGHTTNYLFSKDENISLESILALLNSRAVNYYFKFYNQTNHVPIGEIKTIPIPNCFFSNHPRLHKLAVRRLSGEDVDAKIDALVYELYGLTAEEVKIIEEK